MGWFWKWLLGEVSPIVIHKQGCSGLHGPNASCVVPQTRMWDSSRYMKDQTESRIHRYKYDHAFPLYTMNFGDIEKRILAHMATKEKVMQELMSFRIQFKRIPRQKPWSVKEEALMDALKDMGVDIPTVERAAHEHGSASFVRVICTTDQFTRFIVGRHDKGGENWVSELEPKLGAVEPGPALTIDVSGDSVVGQPIPWVERITPFAMSTYEKEEPSPKTNADLYPNAAKKIAKALSYGYGKLPVFVFRDEVLEEVAAAYDGREKRFLADVSKQRNRSMGDVMIRSAKQCRSVATFVRSMKGGKTATQADTVNRIAWLKVKAKSRKFWVKLDGTRVAAYWFPSGGDGSREVVKIDGQHTYLHENDARLDWVGATHIPFTHVGED